MPRQCRSMRSRGGRSRCGRRSNGPLFWSMETARWSLAKHARQVCKDARVQEGCKDARMQEGCKAVYGRVRVAVPQAGAPLDRTDPAARNKNTRSGCVFRRTTGRSGRVSAPGHTVHTGAQSSSPVGGFLGQNQTGRVSQAVEGSLQSSQQSS